MSMLCIYLFKRRDELWRSTMNYLRSALIYSMESSRFMYSGYQSKMVMTVLLTS